MVVVWAQDFCSIDSATSRSKLSNNKVGTQFIVTGVPGRPDHRLGEEVKNERVRVDLHNLTTSLLWKYKGDGIETTISERMFVATTQSSPTPYFRYLRFLAWATDEHPHKYSSVVCPVEERTNLKIILRPGESTSAVDLNRDLNRHTTWALFFISAVGRVWFALNGPVSNGKMLVSKYSEDNLV